MARHSASSVLWEWTQPLGSAVVPHMLQDAFTCLAKATPERWALLPAIYICSLKYAHIHFLNAAATISTQMSPSQLAKPL